MKEQELPGGHEGINENPNTFDEQAWLVERKKLQDAVFNRVEKEKIRDEVEQELEQNGLFAEDESGKFLIPNRQMIVNIIWDKRISARLDEIAAELPEGAEKQTTVELASDYYAYSLHEQDRYLQWATQDDRGQERYNGEATSQNQLQALDTLKQFGAINEEKLEVEKMLLLQQKEEQIRESLR